jgi:AbrB family looped-hinge helix DNA binding protein
MAKAASKRKRTTAEAPAPAPAPKPRRKIVRQLRNGQITIPKDFRDELGIEPDDLLEVNMIGGILQVRRVKASAKEGSPWLLELYNAFAPVRESLSDLSEQEINDAIDEALREVRASKRDPKS